MKSPVSIIIPTYNQWPLLAACLGSLLATIDVGNTEIFVVDNGSNDETVSALKAAAFPHSRGGLAMSVVANDENRGFAAACNQGLAMAGGEYVLFLNNDTLATPGWLDALLAPMLADPTVGATGPMSNCVSGNQQLPAVGYELKETDLLGMAAHYRQHENWSEDGSEERGRHKDATVSSRGRGLADSVESKGPGLAGESPIWASISDRKSKPLEEMAADAERNRSGCLTEGRLGARSRATKETGVSQMEAFAGAYVRQLRDEAGNDFRKLWISEFRLIGFCLLVRKAVLDQVGGFDEAFEIGNFEDDDLCFRLRAAGYSLVRVRDAFVHHWGSATFKTLPGPAAHAKDKLARCARNLTTLSHKWSERDPGVRAYVQRWRLELARQAVAIDALDLALEQWAAAFDLGPPPEPVLSLQQALASRLSRSPEAIGQFFQPPMSNPLVLKLFKEWMTVPARHQSPDFLQTLRPWAEADEFPDEEAALLLYRYFSLSGEDQTAATIADKATVQFPNSKRWKRYAQRRNSGR